MNYNEIVDQWIEEDEKEVEFLKGEIAYFLKMQSKHLLRNDREMAESLSETIRLLKVELSNEKRELNAKKASRTKDNEFARSFNKFLEKSKEQRQ